MAERVNSVHSIVSCRRFRVYNCSQQSVAGRINSDSQQQSWQVGLTMFTTVQQTCDKMDKEYFTID